MRDGNNRLLVKCHTRKLTVGIVAVGDLLTVRQLALNALAKCVVGVTDSILILPIFNYAIKRIVFTLQFIKVE